MFDQRTSLLLTSFSGTTLLHYLIEKLPESEATLGREDQYGKRYTVDIKVRNLDKEAVVRTGWIIRKDESIPRLTTCYVK